MPTKSKAKGNRLERQIVDIFKQAGVECKRAYGSNGEALGEAATVDNVANLHNQKLRIQAKSRKRIAGFMKVPEGADATILKEDRGVPIIIMNLPDFIDLAKRLALESPESPSLDAQPDSFE